MENKIFNQNNDVIMKTRLNILIPIFIFLCLFFLPANCQWQRIDNGFFGGRIKSLLVSDDKIFAGTAGDGIFISTDLGLNWFKAGLDSLYINTLAESGNNIFAGTNAPPNYNIGGVYLTTDHGKSWNAVNSGLIFIDISFIAANDNITYAGTTGTGIFASTNNGSNWSIITGDLPDSVIEQTVKFVIISDNNIFAGMSGRGIFKTSNNGINWIEINNGLNDLNVSCSVIKNNNIFIGTSFNGIYFSSDKGNNWNFVSNGLVNPFIKSLVINGNNIFAGTLGSGVFFSPDNGLNWYSLNNGLSQQNIYSLATSGNFLYAGTDSGGIFRLDLNTLDVDDHFIVSNNYQMNIFPNPFLTSFNVVFSNKIASKVDIELFDFIGNNIYSNNFDFFESGIHKIKIEPKTEIIPGYYIVAIKFGNEIKIFKIIKVD